MSAEVPPPWVAELIREVRRVADALERIAVEPSGRLPARKRAQRREHVPRAVAPVDELAQAKARKALERAGLR